MARIVWQPLPEPPATYDQAYLAKLINALNRFMFQETAHAQAEVVASTFISTAPVIVDPTGQIPHSVPTTAGLPSGTFYLYRALPPLGSPGAYYVSIVTAEDL